MANRVYKANSIIRATILAFLLWILLVLFLSIFSSIKTHCSVIQESQSSIAVFNKLSKDKNIENNNILARSFSAELCRNTNVKYLLYLPWHYSENNKNWPLLLYLHGGKGRGDNLEKMSWYPVPKMMLRNDSLPFIVIAPQCPAGEMWMDAEMLISLIDDICDSLLVDTNRIYLTGYSMGGAGVWFVAYKYPDKFAAIAPMSGWSIRFSANRFKKLPIWVFHGAEDSIVPISESKAMIEELQEINTEVKASLVIGRGHAPPSIDEHKELFDWLLMQRKEIADTVKIK